MGGMRRRYGVMTLLSMRGILSTGGVDDTLDAIGRIGEMGMVRLIFEGDCDVLL